MDLNALNRLISETYIILEWGLGSPQAGAMPNNQLAERVYRTSWVDTKTDGATYNVGTMIRRVAPGLNQRQAIELIMECHRAVRDGANPFQNMQEVPQRLRKYVS